MARLNWQKATERSILQMQDQSDRAMKSHAVDVAKARQAQQDSGIITFGKHKGKNIETIPTGYLKWLIQNVEPNRYNHKTLEQAKIIIKQRTAQKVGGPVSNTTEEKA